MRHDGEPLTVGLTRRRFIASAAGLVAAAAMVPACGSSSDSADTGDVSGQTTGSSIAPAKQQGPLSGVSIKVHRDPG